MPVSQEALERLAAKDEINDALVRYCRGVDRMDPELVRSAYHEDATDDHGYTVVERGWDLADLVDPDNPNGFPDQWYSSSHVLSNVLIRVDGDRASSESYYTATMRFEHDGNRYELLAIGRYVDQWERRDGGPFKISDRIVVTDSIQTHAIDHMWPGPDSDVSKPYWGAPATPVPDSVPTGSRYKDDPSHRASPALN